MGRISRGYSVYGLPPGTSLEVRRSMPDVYGSLSSVYVAGYTECWLDNLPLTMEQARLLTNQSAVSPPDEYVYLDSYSYSIGLPVGTVLARVRISEKAASRIAGGEPWENVLFGSAPLRIVPKEGEAW